MYAFTTQVRKKTELGNKLVVYQLSKEHLSQSAASLCVTHVTFAEILFQFSNWKSQLFIFRFDNFKHPFIKFKQPGIDAVIR